MPDNFMERITFFITIFTITVTVLLLLWIILYLTRIILQRAARQNAALTNLDLVGHKATVIKTVRGRHPGRIRFEHDGQQIEGDAFSDDLVRRGQEVRITAVNKGCFRIRPLESNLSGETAVAREKSILKDIVELEDISEERSDS